MSDTPEINKSTAITGLVFIVALIIALVLAFTDSFPTSKYIEIQASLFSGSYYPKFTFLLTLMTVWLPMFGIQKVVEKFMNK